MRDHETERKDHSEHRRRRSGHRLPDCVSARLRERRYYLIPRDRRTENPRRSAITNSKSGTGGRRVVGAPILIELIPKMRMRPDLDLELIGERLRRQADALFRRPA